MRPDTALARPVEPSDQPHRDAAGRIRSLLVRRRADLLALATLLGAALWFLHRLVLPPGAVWPSPLHYDMYAFDIPNLYYFADRVLHHGGQGLLWNPLLNCGQPFLGLGTTFSLFPPTPLVPLLGADYTYRALALYAWIVSAVGAFCLGRVLGLSRVAAVCGGLAFAFSNAAINAVTSGPNMGCPFAWLPVALCCVEGILVAPSWRRIAALAVAVAFTSVGHPQFVLFLCQIVFLRVVWEMLSRRQLLEYRALGALAVGFVLGSLLAAVHVFPVFETMGASVHAQALAPGELEPSQVGWKVISAYLAARRELFSPFILVPFMLASAAAWGHQRRIALFYLLAALVFFDLGLGSDGYLFWYYARLPGGRLFHYPHRFLLMTALPVSVLAAMGVDAILTAAGRQAPARRWPILGSMAAVAAAFALLSHGLRPYEWLLTGMVLLASFAVFPHPFARPAAGTALVAALMLDLVVLRPAPLRRLLANSDLLFAQSPVFRLLRKQLTSQERVYLVPEHANFSFELKTPSLFGVPSLDDYNPVVSRRYAEFFTMLRTGQPVRNLNQVIYRLEGYVSPTLARRLLDIAAARYIVTPAALDQTRQIHNPALVPVADFWRVRVYENPSALPRARWVSRVAVVQNDEEMLRWLAGQKTEPLDGGGTVAPKMSRHTALVERAPPSGFLGGPGDVNAATVTFVRDDAEDVVLAVDAPQRGFLVLADQYAPGWYATVNGVSTPIMRADYAFRLVEVPAGRSTVTFRYRPLSVFAGAAVSAVTLVAGVVMFVVGRRGRGGLNSGRAV
jgi:hypothetical protein